MRDAALMAKQRADKQSEFFQKNLNIIVSARNKAITPEAWSASRGQIEYPMPVTGHGGIDLGRSSDFAAAAMVFPFHETDDEGQAFTRYECVTKTWTVRERPQDLRMPMIARWIEDGHMGECSGDAVARWIEDGHMVECSGDAVDFMDVENQILEWHRQYSVETWAYDVRFAPQLAQRIEYEGLTPFAFTQSHKFYTAPLVEIQKIIGKSRVVDGVSVPMFKHDGNPCLAWQAGNLIIDTNPRQEQMPVKGQAVNKIDAMVAILMALSECLYHQQQSDGYWLNNKLAMGG
jgi:phage terminase large subunit-like protein